MKSLGVYYFAVIVPFATKMFLAWTDMINSNWFVFSLIFYLFIYRTYTDGKRLADKGLIEKKDMWRLIIPFYRHRFFKDLYLR